MRVDVEQSGMFLQRSAFCGHVGFAGLGRSIPEINKVHCLSYETGNQPQSIPCTFMNWLSAFPMSNDCLNDRLEFAQLPSDGVFGRTMCNFNGNVPSSNLEVAMENNIRNTSFVMSQNIPHINVMNGTVFESNFNGGTKPLVVYEEFKAIKPELENPIIYPLNSTANSWNLNQASTTSGLSPGIIYTRPDMGSECVVSRDEVFKQSCNAGNLRWFPLTSSQVITKQQNVCLTGAPFDTLRANAWSSYFKKSSLAPSTLKEPNAAGYTKLTCSPISKNPSNDPKTIHKSTRKKIVNNICSVNVDAGRPRALARVRLIATSSTGKKKTVVIKVDPSIPSMDRIKIDHGHLGDIFIGNLQGACSQLLCQENYITVVINLSTKTFIKQPNITYYAFPINDLPSQDIFSLFEKTYNIIEGHLQAGHNVLVNCNMGVSRSSTIVLAYIIKKTRMDVFPALELCRRFRGCCNPNPGFLKQLKKYERRLLKTDFGISTER